MLWCQSVFKEWACLIWLLSNWLEIFYNTWSHDLVLQAGKSIVVDWCCCCGLLRWWQSVSLVPLDLSVDFCIDETKSWSWSLIEHWLLVAFGFLEGFVKHNPNLTLFILFIFIHFAYSGQKGTGWSYEIQQPKVLEFVAIMQSAKFMIH